MRIMNIPVCRLRFQLYGSLFAVKLDRGLKKVCNYFKSPLSSLINPLVTNRLLSPGSKVNIPASFIALLGASKDTRQQLAIKF